MGESLAQVEVRVLRGLPYQVATAVNRRDLHAALERLHAGDWDSDIILRMVLDRGLNDAPQLLARLAALPDRIPDEGGTYVPEGPRYVLAPRPAEAARGAALVRAALAAARSATELPTTG